MRLPMVVATAGVGENRKELEQEMRAAAVEILRVTCPNAAPAAYARLRATAEGSVGVDCEGTDPEIGGPGPLMVQVASSRVVVV